MGKIELNGQLQKLNSDGLKLDSFRKDGKRKFPTLRNLNGLLEKTPFYRDLILNLIKKKQPQLHHQPQVGGNVKNKSAHQVAPITAESSQNTNRKTS